MYMYCVTAALYRYRYIGEIWLKLALLRKEWWFWGWGVGGCGGGVGGRPLLLL